jgi:Trypsin
MVALAAGALVACPVASAASAPAPYVIGGTQVPAGGYPYVAYIRADTGGNTYATCTGSVIAPTIILTAAHCAFNLTTGAALSASAFSVVTGQTNVPTIPAPPPNVTAVHVYPYYNAATFQGDAAILVLATPTAAPAIALATAASGALYAAGQPVSYAGWGETVADVSSSTPSQLQSGNAGILANATCAAAVAFHPGFTLCVAGPNYVPAVCHGDSGGPLVVSSAAGVVQIGITSYGSKTGCGVAPDYFTRVSSVQTWIASAIAGTAAPPVFVPPFNAPAAPPAALSADGVSVTLAAPPADPATLLTSFVVTLLGANGSPLSAQTLVPTATSTVFPNLKPGTYTVSVAAGYSEGSSTATVSTPVTLAPPKNRKHPSVAGPRVVGYSLACRYGTWAWPGAATYKVAWLRNGKLVKGKVGPTYRVLAGDAGKKLACRVTLHASTGPTASAESASVEPGIRLRLLAAPQLHGSASVGSSLVCATGRWAHTGPLGLSVAWRRDGRAIPTATRGLHVVVQADAGHALSCKVRVKVPDQSATYTTGGIEVRG